jgi:hypothetical protein
MPRQRLDAADPGMRIADALPEQRRQPRCEIDQLRVHRRIGLGAR